MLHITPWERSILQLLADGASTAELAARAGLAERDLNITLAALFARLGAATMKDAIGAALRRGLLSDSWSAPIPAGQGLDASRP